MNASNAASSALTQSLQNLKLPGDGGGDQGLAAFLEEGDLMLKTAAHRSCLITTVVQVFDDASLFLKRRKWKAMDPQLLGCQMNDGALIPFNCEHVPFGCGAQAVHQESSIPITMRPHTMYSLLEKTILDLSFPDCSPANLASLTYQKVARLQSTPSSIGRI